MSHHNWTKSDQNKTKHSHNDKFGYWICGHRSTGIDLLLAAISFSRLWTHSSNLANLLNSPNVNQIKLNLWYRNQSEENQKLSRFCYKMKKICTESQITIPLQLLSIAERHCFLLLSLREQSLFFSFFFFVVGQSLIHSSIQFQQWRKTKEITSLLFCSIFDWHYCVLWECDARAKRLLLVMDENIKIHTLIVVDIISVRVSEWMTE